MKSEPRRRGTSCVSEPYMGAEPQGHGPVGTPEGVVPGVLGSQPHHAYSGLARHGSPGLPQALRAVRTQTQE